MSSSVEQVKERLDIVDVVSGYVQLQRAGSNMKARCPFHSERTPSFIVSPARQSYHCFGCGAHGDIFTFIEQIEGVDFKGALQMLAERAGVELEHYKPKETEQERDEKEQMYAAMSQAADYYHQQLLKNDDALRYVHERGFSDDTIARFKIGFAPDDWHAIEKVLVVAGFDKALLEKAGLLIHGEKGYYDRFRSRVMFPMRDVAGRVVAFSGRIFSVDGKAPDDIAKYINSPETPLYNKSRLLYGFDMARQTIRKRDFSILVEGQMDIVACHQAGYTNTVAVSGTALTPEHCTALGRMSKNVILALDADEAGIKAAGRSALIALSQGFDVKVARMPDGADPADILKEDDGKERWKKIIKEAKHIVEFLLDVYEARHTDDERVFKKRVEEVVIPFVAQINSKIDQEHFIKVVAGRIGSSESAVAHAVASVGAPAQRYAEPPERVAPARTENYRATYTPLRLIASALAWQRELDDPAVDIESIEVRAREIAGELAYDSEYEQVSDADKLYVETLYGKRERLQSMLAERLGYLRESTLRAERLKLTEQLHKAESAGDDDAVAQLQAKILEINRTLEASKPQ